MKYNIKLSLPHLSGKEIALASEAISSTWIVPLGPFVDKFEEMLQSFLQTDKPVVALSSGTAAIHLGLIGCGVKRGDEVLCQSLTFAASANPIEYIGAKPIFIDSEISTWNLDPILLENAIIQRYTVTGRYPAAIVAVDLYGMPANWIAIQNVANKYKIPIIEDAAEAIGSEYDNVECGGFGNYGALSFNGNKMITTSGGGALVCPNLEAKEYIKFLSTQARENKPYYYHKTIGYNYRLSNISAAIGCAQMEVLAERIKRRREIKQIYEDLFSKNPLVNVHNEPSHNFKSNYWLTTITIDENAHANAQQIMERLSKLGIETRRIWRPMHLQPVFSNAQAFLNGNSEKIFKTGLCLPSSSTLSDKDIIAVGDEINKLLI